MSASSATADRIVIMPNGKFRLSAVITHCPGYPARPAPSMSIPGKRADRIRVSRMFDPAV